MLLLVMGASLLAQTTDEKCSSNCCEKPVKAMKKVELIAHRGESASAPENTLSSFRRAWEVNADGIEMDIQLSKDGKVMVIHDSNTERVSGQSYVVKETTLEEMRKLDVGSFKDSVFKDERIPVLDEVLATIPEGKKAVIELKSGMDVLPGMEKIVRQSGKQGQIVFIAFDWKTIVEAKKMFPEIPCYWLSSKKELLNDKMNEAVTAGLDGLDLQFSVIDEGLMKKAGELKLGIIAWTVDDPAEAKRLIDLGVIGITTNSTLSLRTKLSEMAK